MAHENIAMYNIEKYNMIQNGIATNTIIDDQSQISLNMNSDLLPISGLRDLG